MKAPELRPDVGPGKAFAYLRPGGWSASGKIEAGGNGGSIDFTQGGALIKIKSDLTGSLMGDVMQASNNQAGSLAGALPGGMGESLSAASNKPPVERLHAMQAQSLAQNLDEFKDGPMQTFRHALGDARFSEYTAKDGGAPVRGIRVTILGGERRYTVRVQCSPDDWPTLEPSFRKIIDSIAAAPE